MSEANAGRFGTSNSENMLLIAALGVGAYVVYKIFQQLQGLEAGVGKAATVVYQGAQIVTAPVSSALAAAWSAMTLQPAMNVTGNVLFPDGSYTPLSQLALKQDTFGNVYVAPPPAGVLFQLQPSDINGDYPASQITDPSQIGKAPS